MNANGRLQLNHEAVTGKIIDGEAVIINVLTGRYYSLEGAGCVAWAQLSAGRSPADAVEAVTARYDVETERLQEDLERLLEELQAEELLVAATQDDPVFVADESALPPAGQGLRPYTGLELLTFRDMEDLLAFDPPLPSIPEQL